MVNREQIKNGLIRYLDTEVMPNVSTAGKWGIGTVAGLISLNFDNVFASLISNTIVQSLGVVNENLMVDSDKLLGAMKKSAEKYGKLTLSYPVIGSLTFSSDDIEKLRQCINMEAH